MHYTKEEVLQYIQEEDVKFVRLAFSDAFGRPKNVAVMASELPHVMEAGYMVRAAEIPGFEDSGNARLLLIPEPDTLTPLPWRPSHGRVIRMLCQVCREQDAAPYEADCRFLLKQAVQHAKELGILCNIGADFEFYLFLNDTDGNPSPKPQDSAGYMDVAPLDRGENLRRDVCLTMEEMGMMPLSSHHEAGPGQNEIDFQCSDPLRAADNALTFRYAVSAVAAQNGLSADFSPKPLDGKPGSGLHIHLLLSSVQNAPIPIDAFAAGILGHMRECTVFFNPIPDSFRRLNDGHHRRHISAAPDGTSILSVSRDNSCISVFSPDCEANPYLAYALLMEAGLDGVRKGRSLHSSVFDNRLALLPASRSEAMEEAKNSSFLRACLPRPILRAYLDRTV